MPEVRPIDANALIKEIAESIKLADEWETESHKNKDKHGLKCAVDTRRSLLAMISRVKDAPTIDAQPVKHGRWIKCDSQPNQKMCSSCRGVGVAKGIAQFFTYCPFCGAYMRGDKDGR